MSARLGIDIGGSGSRVALAIDGEPGPGNRSESADRREFAGPRVRVRAGGDGVGELLGELLRRSRELWPDELAGLSGIGVGATGLATLVSDPDRLVRDIGRLSGPGAPPVLVAIDAVTAHLGALGGRDGAVVSLGTGAIALGRRGAEWRRVDGWGHLLGDRGGGVQVGMRALQLAMRAFDGVDDRGGALLERAVRRFGEPLGWPAQLYTSEDRAGIMAAFAEDVVELAWTDAAAAGIVAEAGEEAARSVCAALRPDQDPVVAATGGLFLGSDALAGAFARELDRLRPDAILVPALGDPLDGALRLAELAAMGDAVATAPFIWDGSGSESGSGSGSAVRG